MIGFLVSLFTELIQVIEVLINLSRWNRAFDVDDIILNTLGATVGYLIYRIFTLLLQKFKNINKAALLNIGRRNIISSREIGGFENMIYDSFTLLQIQPLNLFQQKCFINERLKPGTHEDERKKLFQILHNQRFKPFVRIPSLLTLLITTIIKNKDWDPSSGFGMCSKLLKTYDL